MLVVGGGSRTVGPTGVGTLGGDERAAGPVSEVLAGPYAVACALLVVAGGFKALRPRATTGAVRAVGLPARLATDGLTRALGSGEVILGATAVLTGWAPLAGLVAAAYAAFTGFVVAARRHGTMIQSCGCLGELTVPPSWIHVGVNTSAAAAAIGAAVTRVDGLGATLAEEALAGVPFLALVAAAVWAVVVLITAVPAAMARPLSRSG